MCIDYELAETECCAIRIISQEEWITEKRPSIKAAAQEIRNDLAAQRKQSWPATTVIATVAESVAYPEHHADWWKKVYKKAGFTQMGAGLKNPNSGNIVTKFFINIPEDFKA